MSEVMRQSGDYSKEDLLRAQHNMNMIAAGVTEPVKLRPNVEKHLDYFKTCIEKLGADVVRGALKSKDGRYGKAKITFALNKKDKYQLLQMLGLLDHKGVADAPEQ